MLFRSRLNEPAIDLAIAMAIASSYYDKEIPATDCFVGEIGLTGEVRRVNQIQARVKEAGKVGFKRIFIPKYNMSPALQDLGIEVIPVSSVRQALHYLFS